jgi:enoyl-CoA hydratase/carnithine racemase
MSYSDLTFERRGPVARITLNRPERRNPIGPSTVGELLHALDVVKREDALRVVVITGAGKVFSAGGDLGAMGGGGTPLESGAAPSRLPGTYVDLNLALARLGKPSVAMVNGHALAGGLGLVVACDLAIAADDAQLGTPEINVGLWPMMITVPLLRSMPPKRALELMMTGRRVSAEEGERMGFVSRVVTAEELDAAVGELARTLAGKSPAAMKLGRDAFYGVIDLDAAHGLALLQAGLTIVAGTEDAAEGIGAFQEKRRPTWTGR